MVAINNTHQKLAVDLKKISISQFFWEEWNRECEKKAFEMIRKGHQMTENSMGEIYAEVSDDDTLTLKCEMWGSQLNLDVPVTDWTFN